MRKLRTHFMLLLFMVSLSAFANTASFIIRVDKHQLSIDDQLELRLTLSGDSPNRAPDFSEISKNFDILSRSQSHQMAIFNGQQSVTTELILRLSPKSVGKFTLPSITWGNHQSRSINIEVTEAADTTDQQQPVDDRKIFMSVQLQPKSPYLDSQMTYTVKLYSAIPVHNGKLSEPSGENIWVYPEAAEQHYEVIEQGKVFNVYERNYAIYPKQAGEVTVNSPKFVGYPMDAFFASRNRLSPFNRTPISIKQPAQKVQVKAKPNDRQSTWLPAYDLDMAEYWSDATTSIKVGEPIERTVTIHAQGLTLSQLPEFTWADIPGVRIYPGKVSSSERFDGKHVISERSQTITYIPTQGGQLTIPEIRLPWFNLDKEKAEIAKITSRIFAIVGAPAQTAAAPAAPVESTAANPKPVAPTVQADTPVTTVTTVANNSNTITINKAVLWFSLLFAAAIMVFTYFYAGYKSQPVTNATADPDEKSNHDMLLKQFKKACADNQLHDARKALSDYLELMSSTLSKEKSHQLRSQLAALDALLYGSQQGGPKRWDGKQCWRQCKPYLR